MMFQRLGLFAMACATFVLLASARPSLQAPAAYTVTTVWCGSAVGGASATGINAFGQVVGIKYGRGGFGLFNGGGFVYTNGTLTELPDTSDAYGINAASEIVGNYGEDGSFIYLNGMFTSLGALRTAIDINESRQVAGRIKVGVHPHAALYDGGQVTDLGVLLSGDQSWAQAINASGQVVGYSNKGNDAAGFLYSGGVLIDMSTLGYEGTFVYGLNDRGEVVGKSRSVESGTLKDFAVLWSHGIMRTLGTLGSGSVAFAINNQGQVVGRSSVAGDDINHAFVYSNGVMTDLNNLASPPTGYVLESATAVNDSGMIVGSMVKKPFSDPCAFLLTPTAAAAPAIATSPAVQSVTSGSTASFFVVANGVPLPTYQWQVSSDNGSTWSAVSDGGAYAGAATPRLTMTGVTSAHDGLRFRAVATNTAGSAISAAATLTVTASAVAPTITTQPSTSLVAALTWDATLTVGATGTTPLSYQWSRNGAPITGATHPTLFITDVQTAHGGTYTVTVSNSAGSVTSAPVSLNYVAVAPLSLQFGAARSSASGPVVSVTGAQDVSVSFNGTAPSWTASADQSWVRVTRGSGTGSGQFAVAVDAATLPNTASASAVVTLSAPSVGLTVPVTVTVTIQSAPSDSAPFGVFDTPVSGTTVAGSIAVTGWALDDLGIDRVEIWRDVAAGETTLPYVGPGSGNGKIFITNGTFVAGARPDVEAAFPTHPFAARAGWGYLLLTQGLWNQGNGTYTLHAFAYDQDGHSTALGTKTITSNNASATKPFGAIDTPGYGATVSGNTWNYGWALTPGAGCAVAGGTVQVSIDSGPLLPVAYGSARSDVAAAFPGHTDAGGAGGAYLLDTTTFSNGIHQIGWFVTDSCGRADGIGSRFFTVQNGSSLTTARGDAVGLEARTASDRRVDLHTDASIRRSVGRHADRHVLEVAQGGRIELQLPSIDGAYTGVQIVNGETRALPLGSSLDATHGIFYWQPAPGFLGVYELVFALTATPGGPEGPRYDSGTTRVRVVVGPPLRMAIDTPQTGAPVQQPFTVAGWAIDLAAMEGSGIDTVHAWAYPAAGGAPTFLGVAAIGDSRPDVAATYGAQFERSAYTLIANGLRPGAYDVMVYAHRAATGLFDGAQTIRVIVR